MGVAGFRPLVELADNGCKPLQSKLGQQTRAFDNSATCKSQFTNGNALTMHMEVTSSVKRKRNQLFKSSAPCDLTSDDVCDSSEKKQSKASSNFSCDSPGCAYSSNLLTNLQAHKKRLHSPNYTYACDICENKFKQLKHLQEHVKRHTSATAGSLRCLHKGCNQTVSQSEFKKHAGQHTKTLGVEATHECEHCGLAMKTAALLKTHLNRHFAKLPWHLNCLYGSCRKIFSTSADLRKHVARHNRFSRVPSPKQQKPKTEPDEESSQEVFRCDVAECTFEGKLQSHLSGHRRRVHQNPGFNCRLCGKFFRQMRYLKPHLQHHQTHSPGAYRCAHNGCGHVTDASELETHVLVHEAQPLHTLACTFPGCAKHFQSLKSLCIHKSIAHRPRP
jgi:hypothetical protein